MKKLLTAIAAAVFVIYPSVCFASYIIHLKDGREFAAEQYYEEGDQIKFKRYGGIIGIEKDLVKEIEEVEEVEKRPVVVKKSAPEPETDAAGAETAEKEKTEEGAAKAVAPKQGGAEADATEGTQKKIEVGDSKEETGSREESAQNPPKIENEQAGNDDDKEENKDQKYYMKKKADLQSQLKKALKEYKMAKQKGDEAKTKGIFRQATQLANALEELKKEVKRRNFGTLPYWWDHPQ